MVNAPPKIVARQYTIKDLFLKNGLPLRLIQPFPVLSGLWQCLWRAFWCSVTPRITDLRLIFKCLKIFHCLSEDGGVCVKGSQCFRLSSILRQVMHINAAASNPSGVCSWTIIIGNYLLYSQTLSKTKISTTVKPKTTSTILCSHNAWINKDYYKHIENSAICVNQ